MQVAVVGLDIAKHVFQLHGTDTNGRVVLRRKLRRQEVVPFFANLTACVVGLEACGGDLLPSFRTQTEYDFTL